jgi:hypothetical protein
MGGVLQVSQLHLVSCNGHLVILQCLQNHLEIDLKVLSSSFLISQLLRYGVLTVNSLLHHPFGLLAPSLDLLKCHLQGPNLSFGVLQVVFEVILTLMEICNSQEVDT